MLYVNQQFQMITFHEVIQLSRPFPSKSQGHRGLKSRIEIDRHRCMPLSIIFCLNSFLNIPWGHIYSDINNPQIRKIFPVQMDSEHIHFRNQKHPMYHSTVRFFVEPEYLKKKRISSQYQAFLSAFLIYFEP